MPREPALGSNACCGGSGHLPNVPTAEDFQNGFTRIMQCHCLVGREVFTAIHGLQEEDYRLKAGFITGAFLCLYN